MELVEPEELLENKPLRVYLVTYSQIDPKIFPTRLSFGAAVVQAFGANHVDYFVVSKEPHLHGGYHYHVGIKLSTGMRWHSARKYLKDEFNVNVNFATSGKMYAGAYRYATKSDHSFFQGPVLKAHPEDLSIISKTFEQAANANQTFVENSRKRRQERESSNTPAKKQKGERLKKGDVAIFCVRNKIHTENDAMRIATERRDTGDRALYDFLISMSRKSRTELVQDAWRFEQAQQQADDENCDRIQKLRDALLKECKCEGVWMSLAKDVLSKNSIDHKTFATALALSLKVGRHKDHNIMIHGPGDCAKTFLLKPILDILPLVFKNPASSNFAWLGAEKANMIFLNDLSWAPMEKKEGFIPWDKFLNLLEGFEVTLPAPMNHFSENVVIKKKMPVWATSSKPVFYWVHDRLEPQTPLHETQNDMMSCRWNCFEFSHQFRGKEKIDIEDCTTCFAHFILDFANL